MFIGSTATITASVLPSNAENTDITWSTSNKNVATVSAGKITAKAAGTAVITAKSNNGKTATCKVTVKKIEVTKVALSKTSVVLAAGKNVALKATIAPSNATDKYVTWSTSNSKIATVKAGVVTAKKSGTAIITATASNGKKATCKIVVASVKLNVSSTSVQVGKTSSVVKIASKYPSNDTVKLYRSSNTKIVTVDGKGKIKGKKVGTAKITVTMKSGATATYTVKVQKSPVTAKSLKLNKKSVVLATGKSVKLEVTKNPIAATDKITWTTSNSKIATVKNGVVKAKKAGTVTITAKTSKGVKATCKIVVASVKLNVSSTSVQVGKTSSVVKIASKYPSNDTVKLYRSSNTKIVTVDGKGKIKGKKVGTAKITVTMKSGATATYTVKVQKSPVTAKSLKLNKKSVVLATGKSVKLEVTKNPIAATDKITWTTSNSKIATVKNGVVKAKKAGTVTITAKTSKGVKATCKIVVPSVKLSKTSATVKVGKTVKIKVNKVTVKGDKVVSYKSSNSKVATVKNGVVKGIKKGTATITVKMKSGAKATFKVTVKKK